MGRLGAWIGATSRQGRDCGAHCVAGAWEAGAPPLTDAATGTADRPFPAVARKLASRGPLAVRAEGESQPLEVLRRENELLKKTIMSAESAGKRRRQPGRHGCGWGTPLGRRICAGVHLPRRGRMPAAGACQAAADSSGAPLRRTAGAASLRGSCVLAWPIQPCSLLPPTAVTGLESQLTSAGVSVPPAPSAAAVAARGANGSAAPATPEDYWSPVVHGEWLRGAECCKSVRDRAVCACMLKSGQ